MSLINAPAAPGKAGEPALQNEVLEAAKDKIEGQLLPKTKADYDKVIVAGLRVGLNGGPKSMVASLAQSKNPVQDCATGAINLVTLLYQESRGTMPFQALVPAATVLMLYGMDSAERLGVVKIDAPGLAKAMHFFSNLLMQRLGISTTMLRTAATKVHALAQDPVNMEKMQRAAGTVKSPQSSTPTPMPGGDDGAD